MKEKLLFTQVGYMYLPTTDINNSVQWYTKNLGLKLMDKFEDRGSLIAILHYPHKHAIAVVLVETTDHKPLFIVRNGTQYPVVTMNCPNIERTYQFLKDNDVEVQNINILGSGEAKYFYFKDNQGNLIEAAWSQWDPVDEIKDDFFEHC